MKMRKKISLMVITCLVACMISGVTAFASTSTTSMTYSKMNAVNGNSVTAYRTCYSIGTATKVQLVLNVSSGSDPFTITVKSPSGTEATITPSTKSGTYDLTSYFSGESIKGKWYIVLTNLGYTYDTTKIYPATTVTPTIKITYNS